MEKEFRAILSLLEKAGTEYKTYDHEPVFTSEEAATVRGVDLKTGVKALVFKYKKNDKSDYVLVLVRGDHKADIKRMKEILKSDDISLASPEEVKKASNCEIGSVHPFGNFMGLHTIMDKTIMDNENVNFNAGLHSKSVRMRATDLQRLIRAELVDIAK